MSVAADWLGIVCILIGSLFVLLAGIGMIKFPDLFLRMAAISKAATLGIILIFGAAAIHFFDVIVTLKLFLIVVFLFITLPTASHLIARAGYWSGCKPYRNMVRDDWRGQSS